MGIIKIDNNHDVSMRLQTQIIIHFVSLKSPESKPLLVSKVRYQLASVCFQGGLMDDIQDITSRVIRRSHPFMVRCVRSKLSTHGHKFLHIFRGD